MPMLQFRMGLVSKSHFFCIYFTVFREEIFVDVHPVNLFSICKLLCCVSPLHDNIYISPMI